MFYSISDLEQLSGISVHNIRIWERRYNALQPSRTTGNTRYYDDDQLKRLLNIASLYYSGYKISKACAMSKEETQTFLQQEIDKSVNADNPYEYYIAQIIANGMEYKETEVSQLISQSIQQYGVLDTYKSVLYPLLVRLGLIWQRESLCPSQEHFLSSIFRQKLFAAIDGGRQSAEMNADSWLLFLPEDEDHDLGLLLANYLLKSAGKKVIYLGPKVPLVAISNAASATQPENMLFFMTRARLADDAQTYIDQLVSTFSNKKIFLSGNSRLLNDLKLPNHLKWLRELKDFEDLLNLSLN
jgi:DNA-binding transcriptional MerR regulator